MKVTKYVPGKPVGEQRTVVTESRIIWIETSEGISFSIRETDDGGLSINENTFRHLTIQPEATNAITLRAVMPGHFKIEKETT